MFTGLLNCLWHRGNTNTTRGVTPPLRSISFVLTGDVWIHHQKRLSVSSDDTYMWVTTKFPFLGFSLCWTAASLLHRCNQQEVIITVSLRRISLKCSGQKLWTITSCRIRTVDAGQTAPAAHAALFTPGGPNQHHSCASGVPSLAI